MDNKKYSYNEYDNLIKIKDIAKKIGLNEDDLVFYGEYKAKIKEEVLTKFKSKKDASLVLVSAITPTKAGEGKTTTSIALVDGLNLLHKKAIALLREPSMGPTFGLKGGACGGGKVKIEPETDINLHFTGDMHALTSSINLISAVIDNSIYQGNPLNIDKDRILWQRALDVNDRELREVQIGLGSKINGIQRKEHFVITVASELMAILCIAKDEDDFMKRVGDILVAYSLDGRPIYLKEFNIDNAIFMLMKDALLPNIVQTLEGNPVLVHGGPFANIAHGCASLIGTRYASKLGDILIEEAGFGSDLGAEKFLDIKCREGNLKPKMVVLVATIRALKLHGGQEFDDLNIKNVEALEKGSVNLFKHYESLSKFNLPIVIAINHFDSDDEEEIRTLEKLLRERNIKFAFLDGFIKGGAGAIDLANKVLEVLDTKEKDIEYIYDLNDSIENKINNIAKEIYGAKDVKFSDLALEKIEEIKKLNASNYYICMAKTPNSLSDDPKLLNVPKNFTLNVKDIYVSNGAKFIVVLTGNVLTMPGLPKNPRAVNF